MVAACLVLLYIGAGPAQAGIANAGLPGASSHDPLAGMRWGRYTGPIDGVYPAYVSAHGARKRLMARIALRPLTVWFGSWYSDSSASLVAQQTIQATTNGHPDRLTQVAVFRLDPWESAACSSVPGAAAQASYRRWVDGFAAGIGSSRVALILQPDLPVALCAPSQVPLKLVAYAAKKFNALRHTTVYIDVGAAAWASVPNAVWLLKHAGIRHARGFALNATQYGSTDLQLRYGGQLVRALGAAGIAHKHFVVNTAENGAPFLAGQYPGDANNPRVCRNSHDTICSTLGIPPTWDVSNPRWGLSRADRAIAAREADAYLWIGRPWLDNSGSGPFDFNRALALARSTPF